MSRKSRRPPQTRTMQKAPAMVPGARMAPVRSAQNEQQTQNARRSALSEALRHPTEQQPAGDSKYTGERPVQPPDTIHDVDVGANWFGPMQPVAPYGPPSQQLWFCHPTWGITARWEVLLEKHRTAPAGGKTLTWLEISE